MVLGNFTLSRDVEKEFLVLRLSAWNYAKRKCLLCISKD